MRAIAAKFGGSSTANARGFRRIRQILEGGDYRCAVLSAPGTDERHPEKITDLLGECWDRRNSIDLAQTPLRQVADRFIRIARELGLSAKPDEITAFLLEALALSRERTLSRGEYLCARLFARFSGCRFVDSADVIAFHTDGSLDLDTSISRLRSVFADDTVILPGFYGADPVGHIRTFPRNGSDITGALAAVGMGAAVYENWTDVPGLMTADPGLFSDAKPIPRIGYRQMRLLSRAGARVLHPDCLSIVEEAGIPTHLRCVSRPELPGTWIDGDFDEIVPCVTGRLIGKDEAQITAFSPNPNRYEKIIKEIHPLSARVEEGCVLLGVLQRDYAGALVTVHRMLD